jgi:uncharacterized membrane protein
MSSAISDSVPMTLGSVGSTHDRRSLGSYADTALKAAAGFWFAVTFVGQMLFAFSVASFYGLTAARGDWLAWNKTMTHGYAPGYRVGNTVVAIHLLSAVIIILSGAIQLIPWIRRRAPSFHRWNGRIYMVSAFGVSLAGLYLMWFRGSVGGVPQHLAQSLDAVLIMVCAVMAMRYALARKFQTHRRWALRLYLVVNASLFIRAAAILLAVAPTRGPFGFDPATFQGPFLTELGVAQYLIPLAILELYLRTQQRPGAVRRFAMATALFVVTLALGAGISLAAATNFLPHIKSGFDGRTSIAGVLSTTIAASGIDAAAEQYSRLKVAAPTAYNFDEDQLNTLGYDLLRSRRFKEAIRIFQLNVESYPRSGNVYDSLAEAYMDDGNKPQAIAYYRKSLQLNPKNSGAVAQIQKLNGQ